jgi:hypothetical protein
MQRVALGIILLTGLAIPALAAAQAGEGSLRGVVQDDQGAAIPGVTITATSPALISPSVAISENDGSYRLINLPPGTREGGPARTTSRPGSSRCRGTISTRTSCI